MKRATKARLAAGLTAGAMMFSVAAPAFAAPPVQTTAGNLIAVLNNVNVDLTDVQVVNV